MHSNPNIIMRNGNFLKIVEMGEDALPYIFEKLEEGATGLWWLPLERITGEKITRGVTPVDGAKGWVAISVQEIKAGWLEWGRSRGYLRKAGDE